MEKLDEIYRTLDLVEKQLPGQVRHKTFVPISSVAMIESTIIHTNEYLFSANPLEGFVAVDEDDDRIVTQFEATSILKEQISKTKAANSAPKASENPNPPVSKALPSHTTSLSVSNSNPTSSTSSSPSPSSFASSGKSKAKLSQDSLENVDNAKVFEIREFIDSDGAVMNHELVDVSRDVDKMIDKVSDGINARKNGNPSKKGSATPDVDDDEENEEDDKTKVLNATLDELKSIKATSFSDPSSSFQKLDENLQFVKEMAEMASQYEDQPLASPEQISKILESWDDWESNEQTQVQDLKNIQQGKIIGSGWKKGFLSSKPKKSTPSKAAGKVSDASVVPNFKVSSSEQSTEIQPAIDRNAAQCSPGNIDNKMEELRKKEETKDSGSNNSMGDLKKQDIKRVTLTKPMKSVGSSSSKKSYPLPLQQIPTIHIDEAHASLQPPNSSFSPMTSSSPSSAFTGSVIERF